MARISPGTMTAAIFAILVGLAGAYGVRQYLKPAEVQEQPAEEPPARQMVYVPVAGRDLIAGQTLTMTDIVVRSFTKDEFQQSEFAGRSFMPKTDQIIGQTLRTELSQGSLFLPDLFYPNNMGPGIAEYLKAGHRAVTVPIENIGAVEGFARPGTRVDVLFRTWAEEQLPEVTVTLLDDVEVLAVGRAAVPGQSVQLGGNRTSSGKGSVTLAVTPTEAKALKVAEGRGELSLTLRNPADENETVPVIEGREPMTLRHLIGLRPVERKQMEIYRGGAKEVRQFVTGGTPEFEVRSDGVVTRPVVADRVVEPVSEPRSTSASPTKPADAATTGEIPKVGDIGPPSSFAADGGY